MRMDKFGNLLGPKGDAGNAGLVMMTLRYKGVTFETLLPPETKEFFESDNITKEELLMVKMCDQTLYGLMKMSWKGAWLLQQADWAFEEDEYQ